MIYKLRKKFIKICMLSFMSVFLVLFMLIYFITCIQTNRSLDTLADIVSENEGKFPEFEELKIEENQLFPPKEINQESPFTTRYFTVRFDSSEQPVFVDVRSIASVTREEAIDYANSALHSNWERGWVGSFRYKVYNTSDETAVVFISGADVKEINQNFLFAVSSVFIGGSLIVLFLVIILSKRAVKPVAESYEKQKRFITDANHELKTPLTLIRTNLDIMESENGSCEWLDDIREETELMTELVNQLVTLARMDEEDNKLEKNPFSLSNVFTETVSAFSPVAQKRNVKLNVTAPPQVIYIGNEAAIRQLFSILMDNAMKYCDPNGTINVTLCGGKRPILNIENSYKSVSNLELNHLFDRFYRADKARTYGSGFGVGLSIAKAIVEKHHSSITAQNIDNKTIRFQVKL